METVHKIILGDSREMKEIPDESIHLIVTSPPYWQLKDYGNERQIGFNQTYEEYVNHLNLVWVEANRVLHPGCRLCINIGDQFARSVYYGRYKVIPIRTEIIKFCETIGLDYMGAIIWQKVTTTNTTGGASIMGSYPYPRNGILKLDYEFILIFKKQGKPPTVSKEQKEKSRLSIQEWNQYFTGHWNFGGVRQEGHLAMFPEELPRRLIRMFTFVGETVLDPFLGSGTTTVAAQKLERNSVGYEINEEFLPQIEKKIRGNENLFSPKIRVTISKQKGPLPDFDHKIQKLPYIFKDPLKIDKKMDPRLVQFGSKVTLRETAKKETFRVKEILSAVEIVLSNGMRVRLMGVNEIPEKAAEAREFLNRLFRGKNVFLKYDSQKFDEKNIPLVYLYLSNRTFVNAHLVKNGLVRVNRTLAFRYRERFLRYEMRVLKKRQAIDR